VAEAWKVISNSGELLILERGAERIEIPKPEAPFASQAFMKVLPGAMVTDVIVDLLRWKKRIRTDRA
jgi:hypothetical protein